jgi:uncharacterized protein YdaU (DUF1376 family)
MNYYRRYIGDYLADTQALSMVEDGAYGRLLDFYYASERALPGDLQKLYAIARATKPAEKEAVRTVLKLHFHLGEDGYHNTRADKELGIAVPKIETLRAVARENGKKGGRPPKETQTETRTGFQKEPIPVVDKKPDLVPNKKQPPSTNHQPTAEPLSDYRFPGDDTIPAPPPKAEASHPQSTPEATARIIADCQRAKLEDPSDKNPIIARWIRNGATPTQVATALAEARKSVPEPRAMKAGYVDTILVALMQADQQARRQAEAKVERTQKQLAQQREWKASPMPDNLKPKRKAA